MNSPWLRKSLLGLLFLVGFGSQALALGNHGLFATAYYPVAETVYGVPTSYVVPTTYLSTSYLYPTAAFVYPTSYVYPTTYTTSVLSPASYVVPTYYRATSVLSPRRYVASPVYSTALTYYPTTYYTPTVLTSYYPTVIDYPLVTSSTICAEEVPISSAPPAQAPRSSTSTEGNEHAPSSNAGSFPSNVPPYESPSTPTGNESRTPPEPAPGTPSPPVAPAPDRETSSTPVPPLQSQAAPAQGELPAGNEVNPPPAPAPEPAPTLLRRQARKPVGPTTGRPAGRVSNVLEGTVVSGETRQGEEGVRVILSSLSGNFADRVATTDAFGHYAVRLPDGDWTVKVAMPSGRVYAVSQITISGGQITDNLGREVPSLTITR